MQTAADDSTFDKPHYVETAKVAGWIQGDGKRNSPCLKLKVTFKDGRTHYISLWDKPYEKAEEVSQP